jgi:hypothetical protein
MQSIVSVLIESMKTLVHAHKFELLDRYPSDLLVHDRNMLDELAAPGMRFAWVLGHAHTHLVTLGLHVEENTLVDCFTNLSSTDKFFVIHIHNGGGFSIDEISRDSFKLLRHARVPYSAIGDDLNFTLYREKRVGYVSIKRTGPFGYVRYEVSITPYATATAADLAALKIWASHRVRAAAGTLFVNTTYTTMPACVAVA